jgi:hypothetical protein
LAIDIFFHGGGAGIRTQRFALARQVLYSLSHALHPGWTVFLTFYTIYQILPSPTGKGDFILDT